MEVKDRRRLTWTGRSGEGGEVRIDGARRGTAGLAGTVPHRRSLDRRGEAGMESRGRRDLDGSGLIWKVRQEE